MGAFLDKPNTAKLLQEGQLLIPALQADALARSGSGASAAGSASAAASGTLPAAYLVKFGGASMQGWRKYQEDRVSCMYLRGGHTPVRNVEPASSASPASPKSDDSPRSAAAIAATRAGYEAAVVRTEAAMATVSGPDIHMLFLSIFDGHGGAETSAFAHSHFHPFLRQRVEEAMDEWRKAKEAWAAGGMVVAKERAAAATAQNGPTRKRRTSSVSEMDLSAAAAAGEASANAAAAPSRSRSHSSPGLTGPPPYPLDAAFLTQAFLDFDASLPLPPPSVLPRNAAPLQAGMGGMRRQQPPPPPEGNNIPHLASGTTATLCIVDLANHQTQQQSHALEAARQQSRMSPVEEVKSKSSSHKKKHGNGGKADASDKGASAAASAAASSSVIPAGSPSTGPSTAFSLLLATRDHHPDDPGERQRMTTLDYENTFLNWQPPSNSRICHLRQRISLNVVRGFGDAWFKMEERSDWKGVTRRISQREQMVCAVPEVWSARFPLAAADAEQSKHKAESKKLTSVSPAAARPPSPADSRCTTPVLQLSGVQSDSSVLPPAGETLYVLLASDGIWNSEFPPNTPGVSIPHGALWVSSGMQEPLQRAMFPPAAASAAAHASAARPVQPVTARTPLRPAPSGDSSSDSSESESERGPAARNPDSVSEESDDDSDGDIEFTDMAVNLAVSQFFYNQAQPIVEKIVSERTGGHAPPPATSAAAASASALVPSKPKTGPSRVVGGRRTSVSSSPSMGAPAAASAAAPAAPPSYSSVVSQALDLLMAQPPLTKQNLKATDNMSAFLITITPIGVATGGQSATTPMLTQASDDDSFDFVSFTPAQPASPAANSSLAALPSPTIRGTAGGRVAAASSSVALATPSAAAPKSALSNLSSPDTPSTPQTPKFFNAFTPPLVQQRSLPLRTDTKSGTAGGGGARSTSMPSPIPQSSSAAGAAVAGPAPQAAGGIPPPQFMSPPRMKKTLSDRTAQALPTPAPERGGAPAVVPASTAPLSASSFIPIPPSPSSGYAGRRSLRTSAGPPLVRTHSDASNAPTPFLDEIDKSPLAKPASRRRRSSPMDIDESPPVASSPERTPSPVPTAAGDAEAVERPSSKKRRRAQLHSSSSDASPEPQGPLLARMPSRTEAVGGLLFSGGSIASQLSPSPPPPAPAERPAAPGVSSVASLPHADAHPSASSKRKRAASKGRQSGSHDVPAAAVAPSPSFAAAAPAPAPVPTSHSPPALVGTLVPAARAPARGDKGSRPRHTLQLQPLPPPLQSLLPLPPGSLSARAARASPRKRDPSPLPAGLSASASSSRGRRASLPALPATGSQAQAQVQVQATGPGVPATPLSSSVLASHGRKGRARARTAAARLVGASPLLAAQAAPAQAVVAPAVVSPPALPLVKSGQQTAAQVAETTASARRAATKQHSLPPVTGAKSAGSNARYTGASGQPQPQLQPQALTSPRQLRKRAKLES